MPSNIIIELAERNGVQGESTSEWTNTFENVSIETGDVIQVKTALINTLDANTNNIVIQEDVEAKIVVGVYDNPLLDGAQFISADLTTNGGSYSQFRKPVRTGQTIDNSTQLYNNPWVAVKKTADGYELFANTITITIKAGVYEPDDLANQITQQMQQFSEFGRNMFFATNNSSDNSNFQPGEIANNAEQLVNNDVIMVHVGSVETIITQQKVPFLNDAAAPMYSFQTDPQNEFYALGAPSAELSFDGQRFLFKFLHTPLMISSNVNQNPPYDNMAISIYEGGVVRRNSGVYLRGLTPVSFWAKLGFNSTTEFLNTDDIVAGFDVPEQIEKCTTKQYAGADAFRNKSQRSVPQLKSGANYTWLQYGTSDISTEIVPKDTYQSDGIGYYLLETVTNFKTDYQTNGTITSIMSKQYNNADFITVYAESSIPYQHVGEPIVLSTCTCRILDPTTNNPVGNLGDASVVFLEIIKAPPPAIKSK